MLQSTRGLSATAALTLTGKPYNPSANSMQNNAASWATLQAYFKANKVVTYGKLQAHLQQTHNHGNFVGWCVRQGRVAPAAK